MLDRQVRLNRFDAWTCGFHGQSLNAAESVQDAIRDATVHVGPLVRYESQGWGPQGIEDPGSVLRKGLLNEGMCQAPDMFGRISERAPAGFKRRKCHPSRPR